MQVDDWTDLQAFLAVARAGQLARAGVVLGKDATTLGRRLRRLEARLGATLFERTREGQVLTEAGEALLAKVEMMAQLASNIGENSQSSSGVSGTLRISVSEGFGSIFLPRHIPSLAVAHSNLRLDLVASSGFLSPSKREADIAVMLSRPKSGQVICRKLSDYALRLYASPEYLELHGTPQVPADLMNGHRLLGYIPDLLYAPELSYLDEIHADLTPQLRSSSIIAQANLITNACGIGVLPCFIGDTNARLVPVLPDRMIIRHFWMVSHKDTSQLNKVRAGKDWLIAAVRRDRSILLPSPVSH